MRLLTDARLSSDARVLGLYIASRGEGFHEIPRDELGDVLTNQCSRDRVQRALGQLVRFAWLVRKPGGRGHADSFAFTKVADSPAPKVDSDQDSRQVKATGGEDERRREPPVIPLFNSEAAEAAIAQHGEKLAGCRGALRDYLKARVPASRQSAYVHALAGWIDGISPWVWKRPDGSSLPDERKPGAIAAALNDLAASDESRMKRPQGDIGNLETKLEFQLKRGAYRESGNGSNRRRAVGETPNSTGTGGSQAHRRRRTYGSD